MSPEDEWFAGDPDLSGEYLVGYQDVVDAGDAMPRGVDDPPIYASLFDEQMSR